MHWKPLESFFCVDALHLVVSLVRFVIQKASLLRFVTETIVCRPPDPSIGEPSGPLIGWQPPCHTTVALSVDPSGVNETGPPPAFRADAHRKVTFLPFPTARVCSSSLHFQDILRIQAHHTATPKNITQLFTAKYTLVFSHGYRSRQVSSPYIHCGGGGIPRLSIVRCMGTTVLSL
jgi:hypothetical protein